MSTTNQPDTRIERGRGTVEAYTSNKPTHNSTRSSTHPTSPDPTRLRNPSKPIIHNPAKSPNTSAESQVIRDAYLLSEVRPVVVANCPLDTTLWNPHKLLFREAGPFVEELELVGAILELGVNVLASDDDVLRLPLVEDGCQKAGHVARCKHWDSLLQHKDAVYIVQPLHPPSRGLHQCSLPIPVTVDFSIKTLKSNLFQRLPCCNSDAAR
ncbi:hypothetical protein BDK51DRAFT_46664 [Blyttiomyces helicus]|uniref:Uncharacterized protein n=1 Tax=Blyttiomyces helicus TaxID=388810 RepID=A0A4P9WF65_9FUNG|nr:hypothetical protein BDK51DRAFT_46664 [Blyttiomyces helicus]|eukprot:RKO90373.1 hypothetical protein BDK51DRAFT_46664 [Blyttiomyces helicus]